MKRNELAFDEILRWGNRHIRNCRSPFTFISDLESGVVATHIKESYRCLNTEDEYYLMKEWLSTYSREQFSNMLNNFSQE